MSKGRKSNKKCIFLGYPRIADIKEGISKYLKDKKCQQIIFDNVSVLLHFHSSMEIQQLTNTFVTEPLFRHKNKIYVMQKDEDIAREESKKLIKELRLFANNIFDIS